LGSEDWELEGWGFLVDAWGFLSWSLGDGVGSRERWTPHAFLWHDFIRGYACHLESGVLLYSISGKARDFSRRLHSEIRERV
jgi:hypothetical protein